MLVGTLETPAQPVELKPHVFKCWSTTPSSPPVTPVKATATVDAAA